MEVLRAFPHLCSGNMLSAAKTSLKNCEEDLDFLGEQTTRVYNWDVGMRRKEQTEHEESIKESKAEPPYG